MDALTPERSNIIDAHCHIASMDIIPRSFIDGAISNVVTAMTAQGLRVSASKLAKMYEEKMNDPLCDELVVEMERAGIAKSVLLAADFSFALKDCRLTVEESFARHRAVLAKHPGKFEVFGGVDPRWGKDGLALFEKSLVDFGFCGFKVYPPCGFSPSDPSLFPFYELCAAHRVPVLLHIGPTSPALSFETSNPFLVDGAARNFPSVNFILAHAPISFREECVMLCGYRPNVYLDVSGYQSSIRDGVDRAVGHLTSRGIDHKIIFGTDWPVFRLQSHQKMFVDAIVAERGPLSELSDTARAGVLHANIERLLQSHVPVASAAVQ
jgi:predicted TIM-barrel fold metal-dependent hydrolase